jgi:hypothetical protein
MYCIRKFKGVQHPSTWKVLGLVLLGVFGVVRSEEARDPLSKGG